MTYAQIKMRLADVGDVVKALEKLQKDNKNALLTPAITEAVRRAKAEQGHYQGQFDAMVADNTDLNADNTTAMRQPCRIRSCCDTVSTRRPRPLATTRVWN